MMQHEQHTKKFIRELNAVNHNKINPISESNMTWKFGKYKGFKLIKIPVGYLKWAINKMNLSDTAKCIIKQTWEQRKLNTKIMQQKNNSGTLFRYTGKKDNKAASPDYRGTAMVNEKQYQMAAWVNKSRAGQNYLRIYFFDVAKDPNPTGQITEQGRIEIGSGLKDQAGNVDSVMLDDLPF